MPEVRNRKSQAKDFNYGAATSRGRIANSPCSRFVLGAWIATNLAIGVTIDIPTASCQGPSVSRESAPAAKLQQPKDWSRTIGWRPFNQA
jgi:hypothetical protein